MSFSSTSINYEQKFYSDIFTILMEGGQTKGILSNNINIQNVLSNPQAYADYYIIIQYSVISNLMATAWSDLTTVKNGLNMNLAPSNDPVQIGDALQILASPFIGNPYPPGYALTSVTFTADEAPSSDITIPMGTQIPSNVNPNIIFQTTVTDSLLASTTSVTIQVQCTTNGPTGNVAADTLTMLVNPIDGINSVNNTDSATGGTIGESRGSYLQRFINWHYINIHGTYDSLVAAVNSVSCVTGSYIDPKPPLDGYPQLGLTIVTITPPTEQVINAVIAAINLWKAVDENVEVQGATEEAVNITASANYNLNRVIPYSVSDETRFNELVVNYLTIFIDGGSNVDGTVHKALGIGQDFIVSQAVRYVLEQISQLEDLVLYEENGTTPLANQIINNNEVAVAGTITAAVTPS